MLRSAIVALLLLGCRDDALLGAAATELFPADVDHAVVRWLTLEGLPPDCYREVHRMRVVVKAEDDVTSLCRNPRAGACVDYFHGKPLAVVAADDEEGEHVQHEIGHVISRCKLGVWDFEHDHDYFDRDVSCSRSRSGVDIAGLGVMLTPESQ